MSRFLRKWMLVAVALCLFMTGAFFANGNFFPDLASGFSLESDSLLLMNSETIKVEGRSMDPLIRSGSVMTQIRGYYNSSEEVRRGDVVTFYIPSERRLFIKRVVAIPGDNVTLVDRLLYVNEEPVKTSKGIDYVIDSDFLGALLKLTPIVPNGSVLVLGERRRGSMDSSRLGFVPIATLVGKVLLEKQ